MRSMTGFGRGVVENGGIRATVDIRTVNHRFLDLKLRGLSLSPALEEAVSQRVRAAIERGSVAVSVNVQTRATVGGGARIDRAAAAAVHAELTSLAQQLGTPPPDLALVLAQPGVSRVDGPDAMDEAAVSAVVLPALDAALAQLEHMRTTEGAALATELRARVNELVAVRTQIATLAAGLPAALTKRLSDRLTKLLANNPDANAIEPARLAQEVALLADRADVTEELVRLASHLEQLTALIAGTAAAGRRLEFLVQEIGRELNTIGSKSALGEITSAVVDAKSVLEKIREQIQNVE